jgi:hypothetical protein
MTLPSQEEAEESLTSPFVLIFLIYQVAYGLFVYLCFSLEVYN